MQLRQNKDDFVAMQLPKYVTNLTDTAAEGKAQRYAGMV